MNRVEGSAFYNLRFFRKLWHRRMTEALMVVVAIVTGTGCAAVGPDYERPEVGLPVQWTQPLRGGLSPTEPEAEALGTWWTTLGDPVLSDLMERALAGNLNVKSAEARIHEARARHGIAEAGRLPAFKATAATSLSGSSDNSGSTRREQYKTGFDASWEIDIFGGVRRSIEAIRGDFEATVADRHDVLASLLAEVALNYVEMRTLQAQLHAAQESLKAQAETLQFSEWRFAAGLVSQLDVEQAKASLESTPSQLPSLRVGIEAAKNRLAILLGVVPGTLESLATKREIPEPPLEVAVGVPAEALRRRPDVRRAERQLATQTAGIGVATAELYPKLSLPGSIDIEALSARNLFPAGSRVWNFLGAFAWNLFNGGVLRQNIEVQTALQEQALRNYERTLLNALEEVENALVAYAQEQERRTIPGEASQAAQRAAELARDQYTSGLIDFQVVLDAQRSALSFQDQLAVSKGQVTSNVVRLYKALGGGWMTVPGMAS